MPSPVTPASASDPVDWRLYRRVGTLVAIPAWLALCLLLLNRSGLGITVAVSLAILTVIANTFVIVGPMLRTASRLRKTARDLKAVLPHEVPSTTISPNQNPDELVAAEEQLFAIGGRVQAELKALRELARHLE